MKKMSKLLLLLTIIPLTIYSMYNEPPTHLVINDREYVSLEDFVKQNPTHATQMLQKMAYQNAYYQGQIKVLQEGESQLLRNKQEETLKELQDNIQKTKDIQKQYETSMRRNNKWNKLILPVYRGLEGLTYISFAYCVISLHNDVCATPSHTSLHYYLCNPLG